MSYLSFFQLNQPPFRLPPDPAFFFPGAQYDEGLDTLHYGITAGEGFIQITGKPGVGKTLLIRSLLADLDDQVKTALILHPRLSPEELLRVILVDLGTEPESIEGRSKEALLRAFRDTLLAQAAQGTRTVVIIDEAQNLPDATLEELRLLSNLETEKDKLLQIILAGQPELEDKLAQPVFTQLSQRITIRYRLEPLNLEETGNYISHRLRRAGADSSVFFTGASLKRIHRESGGIPRLINSLCERALMAASLDHRRKITAEHVSKAVRSLSPEQGGNPRRGEGKAKALSLVVLVMLLAGGGWYLARHQDEVVELIARLRPEQPQALSIPQSAVEQPQVVSAPQSAVEQSEAVQEPLPVAEPSPPEVVSEGKEEPLLPEPLLSGTLIPPDWPVAILAPQGGGTVLWTSTAGGQTPIAEIGPGRLGRGIYLLGRNEQGRFFLFNPETLFSWQDEEPLAARLWPLVDPASNVPLVPVFVPGKTQQALPTALAAAAEELRLALLSWADSWRAMDTERHLAHYDAALVTYRPFQDKPTVLSEEQHAARKSRLFEQASGIVVQISRPLILIDPEKPESGIAVFQQRYSSSRYADFGIQALYFRRTSPPGEDQASPGPAWKITARLWLPLDPGSSQTSDPEEREVEVNQMDRPQVEPEPLAER